MKKVVAKSVHDALNGQKCYRRSSYAKGRLTRPGGTDAQILDPLRLNWITPLHPDRFRLQPDILPEFRLKTNTRVRMQEGTSENGLPLRLANWKHRSQHRCTKSLKALLAKKQNNNTDRLTTAKDHRRQWQENENIPRWTTVQPTGEGSTRQVQKRFRSAKDNQ